MQVHCPFLPSFLDRCVSEHVFSLLGQQDSYGCIGFLGLCSLLSAESVQLPVLPTCKKPRAGSSSSISVARGGERNQRWAAEGEKESTRAPAPSPSPSYELVIIYVANQDPGLDWSTLLGSLCDSCWDACRLSSGEPPKGCYTSRISNVHMRGRSWEDLFDSGKYLIWMVARLATPTTMHAWRQIVLTLKSQNLKCVLCLCRAVYDSWPMAPRRLRDWRSSLASSGLCYSSSLIFAHMLQIAVINLCIMTHLCVILKRVHATQGLGGLLRLVVGLYGVDGENVRRRYAVW